LSDGRVGIGPLRRDLVDLYVSWQNDPIVMRGEGRTEPETVAGRAAGLEAQLAGRNAHFTSYDLADPDAPAPIGTASLIIDHTVRAAEYVVALGESGRGRGLAAPLTALVLKYAFHVVGLRNVMLHVLEPNVAAVRAYRAAGYRTVGVRRDCAYWGEEPCGEILMDAVPSDLRPAL
jgi:RimJ/RimL family protein N-acetyltransferase